MKKIVLLIVCTLFSFFCFTPLIAKADNQIIEDISTLDFYSFEQFENAQNFFKTGRSIEFQAMYKDPNSNSVYFFTSGLHTSDSAYSNVSITRNDSIVTVDLGVSQPLYSAYHVYSFDSLNFDSLYGIGLDHHHSLYCKDGSQDVSSRVFIRSLSLDYSSKILNLYKDDGSLYRSYIFHDIKSNFDNIDQCNDIDVVLFPELTKNFNYTAEFEGSEIPLNVLQVDIYNNTNSSYQYAILIQPKGSYLETDSHSNSRNTTVFWGDSPVTYALFKDEWIYVPGTYEAGHQLVNTPSAWHYLPATEMKREHIYYDQMMLKAGEEYTFKVIAYDLRYEYSLEYPIDYPRAVAPPISSNKDTYSPSAQIVYSVDFSVKSDTKFDPNSNANGSYSFDPNSSLDSQFDKIKAIYNGNGQVEITEGSDFSRVYQNSSSGYNSSSYIASNGKTYNYLINSSSSYLGLCNGVFNYLPPFVRDLIYCGLLGIVVIFILKLFKG